MDHYIEIQLKPDPEFSTNTLMNALFAKLHRALVERGNTQIGVSFPKVGKNLGNTLRLHGTQEALQQLIQQPHWMRGLHDYAIATEIQPIPSTCQYRNVKRIQVKSSPARLFRRSVKKGWITEEEADQRLKRSKEQQLKDPFIQLKSQSSGQVFRLFIRHGPLMDHPKAGAFSAYGLSHQATIPWF